MTDETPIPRVAVRATWVPTRDYKEGGFWQLTMLALCPYCGKRHSHGGGCDATPDGGYRSPHCADGHRHPAYELVVTEVRGRGPAR